MFHIFKKENQIKVLTISLLVIVAVIGVIFGSLYNEAQNKVNSATKSISELESKIELKSEIQSKLSSELAYEKEVNTEMEDEIKKYKTSLKELESKILELESETKRLKLELDKKIANDKAQAQIKAKEKEVSVSRGTSYGGKNNNAVADATFKTFQATAYTAYCTGCSGVTREGIDLRKNPNLKVIAVDPKVIKLGSLVEIVSESYPSINGTYVAGDTGGDIKGNRIDIFIPTKEKMRDFGRRDIKVKVIRNGW